MSKPLPGRAAALLLASLATAQEATAPVRRALLVGCSEYPALRGSTGARYEPEVRLHGPGNDVVLVRDTLERVLGLAPEHATVLAGWREDATSRPTRANILAALERLAREARAGDQVIVYLAGHGSQQRVQRLDPEEEPDGLEEIFLAADARAAEEDQGYVPNSIRDEELGARVRAIRDAGAEVWLILDACHAGTMLRSAAGGVRLRGLAPALLGVGGALRGGPARWPERAGGWLDGDTTRIAALYGTTSYGRAPEMELPRDAPDARPQGLFTYLLCQELERLGPQATYLELAERVVAAYQAFPCAHTVPTAEGDLGRAIGGGLAPENALQCTLKNGVPFLTQGRLAGIEPGVVAELFVLEDGSERWSARLEVVEADLLQARGKLLAGELVPEQGPWRARAEARPLGDYRLALALVHPDGRAAAAEELPEALRAALEREASSFPILADPGAADWWIVLAGSGRLWLRPGPREGGFDLCDVRPERLLESLDAIQKTRNLRRFAGSAFTSGWRGDLRVRIEREDEPDAWRELGSEELLRPGDRIRVRIEKPGDAIYDVNVFYLDAGFGWKFLEPGSGTTRMDATTHERLVPPQWIVDDALGLENLLVFATPRNEGSKVVDLRWLERRTLTRGAQSSREPFEELLHSIWAGRELRGAVTPVAGTRGTQSLLRTLRTAWGPLAPPPWPSRTAAVERPERPAATGWRLEPGDPWEIGVRAALARSRPRLSGHDLLLLGADEVEAVLVDFDASAAEDADPAALVRTRAFDAEVALVFGARRLAYYDRDDRGCLDLALEDADEDGVAEVRWWLEGERWQRDAPVALPWLSQGHVPRQGRRTTEISASLQVLQRPR